MIDKRMTIPTSSSYFPYYWMCRMAYLLLEENERTIALTNDDTDDLTVGYCWSIYEIRKSDSLCTCRTSRTYKEAVDMLKAKGFI